MVARALTPTLTSAADNTKVVVTSRVFSSRLQAPQRLRHNDCRATRERYHQYPRLLQIRPNACKLAALPHLTFCALTKEELGHFPSKSIPIGMISFVIGRKQSHKFTAVSITLLAPGFDRHHAICQTALLCSLALVCFSTVEYLSGPTVRAGI